MDFSSVKIYPLVFGLYLLNRGRPLLVSRILELVEYFNNFLSKLKPYLEFLVFKIVDSFLVSILKVQFTKLFEFQVFFLFLKIEKFLTFLPPVVVVCLFQRNSFVSNVLESGLSIINLESIVQEYFKHLFCNSIDFEMIFHKNLFSRQRSNCALGYNF